MISIGGPFPTFQLYIFYETLIKKALRFLKSCKASFTKRWSYKKLFSECFI